MGPPAKDFRIPIRVEEQHGIERSHDPVRLGVPVPRGQLFDATCVHLKDESGKHLPCQGRALAHWPDASVKWLLLDFIATLGEGESTVFTLAPGPDVSEDSHATAESSLHLTESAEWVEVDTGKATFIVPRREFSPFSAIRVQDNSSPTVRGSKVRLTDMKGTEYLPIVARLAIEEAGPLRATILVEGNFLSGNHSLPISFKARMAFFGDLPAVQLEFQITNRGAAVHPGGLWDLGDPGSVFFSDLSFHFYPYGEVSEIAWYAANHKQVCVDRPGQWALYQDSSGGENWNSTNHVDHTGSVAVSFRGYRAYKLQNGHRKMIEEGARANPCVRLFTSSGSMAAGVKDFWQNFPKAMRVDGDCLSIGLFPSESTRGYELQGGEQKRHTLFLDIGPSEQQIMIPAMMNPLHAWVDPVWVEGSKAVSSFVALPNDMQDGSTAYVGNVVEGPNSFFNKREIIDEYGWRNFGDLYADHEAVNHPGPNPLISHYNNQYDFIYGALARYLGTGDRRWFQLMDEAARHTIDIDIYHTSEDKSAYSHGLFWHTDHYRGAGTSTHRTYSRKDGIGGSYGGGPSNEHNYTSGLLHYYYLTGDPEAAEAVLELAGWVIAMDDGSRNLLGIIDDGPTGGASSTVSPLFHKPGRGAGNSINALIDAYRLSNDRRFMTKAEELIQRCIHPHDDIEELTLDKPEYRWSYLVFLQTLGKYLMTKSELGEIDYFFYYARDSLLHYTEWMAKHEVPYKDVLHKVEIPTETWPAQDVRKCHVFHLAASYGPPEKRRTYKEKAAFFQERCLNDLLSFETAYLTRPMVILTVYGHIHSFFEKYGDSGLEISPHTHDFGSSKPFLPQSARVKTALSRKLTVLGENVRRIARCKWYELKSRIEAKP
jgi:hypothetical protein